MFRAEIYDIYLQSITIKVITLSKNKEVWKNLIVTLIISTLISFLILCTINFLFGHGIYIPWSDHSHWTEILSIEIILMSLVIGGVSTSMIMLGTFISKNNR
ncbi:hypothetical protein B9X66_00500 [Acinetobacter pittii]|uniref:Uncharacterized protein n=4 Tax=Acinetobacter calcoaceticus/baumannii complex TaxID=909768 RepID=A0A241ZFP9_ACIBA|nr:hypothetical protein B9X43_11725 [Acinetobacter baumannii]OTL06558.1 hypothetical protein B9X83_00505 [Acinetobacter nosocomialis]OTM75368.1 hypothetical protein B9X97_10550 [Acinetobacter pittii]OTL10357.1 hypothetical protein B9X80_19645 [Acinetobacter nosocomialis]OTM00831.1 hypothetical protein B9X58_02430 [Acinetobacter nosocomialis]